MTKHEADLNTWMAVIKREYCEMPGLKLTKPQMRRMWGLDEVDCEVILDTLKRANFLRASSRGYVLANGERIDARTTARIH